MLVYLLQGITLGFSAGVSPGPYQAYLIGQTTRLGWRRAMPAVLAPLLSDGPIIALVLLALSRLPEGFLRALQVAGGLFVLYLAWSAARAFRAGPPSALQPQDGQRQSVLEAGLMNFLNPNPWIFWSVLAGPILVQGWQQGPGYAAAFLIGFYATMLAVSAVLVGVFGMARRLGPRLNHILIGVSALALFGFGIYQLVTGLAG